MVTAPATASGDEGTLITFTVVGGGSGRRCDHEPHGGSAITAGATFTKNAANTSGTFSWTPSFTQSGSYSVTFTASNALSGFGDDGITVNNVDRLRWSRLRRPLPARRTR